VTGPTDKPSDDATWREIVANYGERVLGPEDDARVTEQQTEPDPRPPELAPRPEAMDVSAEERFVPPPPPPLPRPPKDRLAAWLGVFVSPVILLLATVFRISLPTPVAWLLIGGFLGGFGYLVAQMPRGPRDPFDDGAVL
jgi:hypothetical protein